MSPYQLWIEGMSRLNTDPAAVEGAMEGNEDYGIDLDGPHVSHTGDIVMYDLNCPLTEQELTQLKSLVDPMQACGDFGIAFYITVREYVYAFC